MPGQTNLVKHITRLKQGVVPEAQAPYLLNPEKLKVLDKEIEDLWPQRIIEKSYSA